MMGTIAGTNASHGLGHDVFGFFVRKGFAGGVHLRKIFPQLRRDFQFPLRRNGGRLKGAYADSFALLDSASQKRFDSGLLVRRQILSITDHGMAPGHIMTGCIPEFRGGLSRET